MKNSPLHKFRALGASLVACSLFTFTSCETQAQKGALIGGLGGAAIGGIAGDGGGALLGGAIGAATGAVIGSSQDRRRGNYGRHYDDRSNYRHSSYNRGHYSNGYRR